MSCTCIYVLEMVIYMVKDLSTIIVVAMACGGCLFNCYLLFVIAKNNDWWYFSLFLALGICVLVILVIKYYLYI